MVAGLIAADHLFELDADVFALAAELEGHPDNVGAALEGGFVVCNGAQAHRFEAPMGLEAVLVVPDEGPPTEEARDALPATVPIEAAVFNMSHAAMLTLGLATADWDLISAGPARSAASAPPRAPVPALGRAARARAEASGRSGRRSPAPVRPCSCGAGTTRPAPVDRRAEARDRRLGDGDARRFEPQGADVRSL